jgi:hypothetical protein
LPGSAEESKNGVHNGRMSEDEEWRNSLRRSSVSYNGNGNALRASSYNLPSIDNRTRFVYFFWPFTLLAVEHPFDGILRKSMTTAPLASSAKERIISKFKFGY